MSQSLNPSINVAVTGVTGKSGRAFLAEVAREGSGGRRITAIVRPGRRVELPAGVDVREADLANPQQTAAVMAAGRYDLIVHIAGIHLTENVARAAADAGSTRRIIAVHTTGIWSRHKREARKYAETERRVAAIAADAGISINLLRPTMIYGDGTDSTIAALVRMAARWPVVPLPGGGRGLIQPVVYGDVGRACYRAMMRADRLGERSYVISGQKPAPVADVVKMISMLLGRNVPTVTLPMWAARGMAAALYGATIGLVDLREKIARLGESRAFPYGAAARDLDYSPMSLLEGLVAEIDAMQSRGLT